MPFDDAEGPWWFPSWTEVAKLLGWRWIFAVPSVAVLAVIAMGFLDRRYMGLLWVLGFKLLALAVGVPIALLANSARSAVQMRKEPFCIHCGYGLTGLPDNHICPECGRRFNLALVNEYRRNPHWFIERCKTARFLPPTHAPFAAGPVSSPRSGDGT